MSEAYAQTRNCFSNIGILIPMKIESTYLLTQMHNKKDVFLNGIHFIKGEIAGHQIIFNHTGVGKINAAIATTDFIKQFHPDIILMSGSAGNLNKNIHPTDTVIGTELINVDLGHLTSIGPIIPKKLMCNCYFNLKLHKTLELDTSLNNIIHQMKYSNQYSKV